MSSRLQLLFRGCTWSPRIAGTHDAAQGRCLILHRCCNRLRVRSCIMLRQALQLGSVSHRIRFHVSSSNGRHPSTIRFGLNRRAFQSCSVAKSKGKTKIWQIAHTHHVGLLRPHGVARRSRNYQELTGVRKSHPLLPTPERLRRIFFNGSRRMRDGDSAAPGAIALLGGENAQYFHTGRLEIHAKCVTVCRHLTSIAECVMYSENHLLAASIS